jgi:DNA-binding NarL/FixJ family response regulator
MQTRTHPPATDEPPPTVSILLVGGSLFSRIGVVSTLDQESGFTVVGHVSHSADVGRLVAERTPDVAVLIGEIDVLPTLQALMAGAWVPRILVVPTFRKRPRGEEARLPFPEIACVPEVIVNLTDIATLVPAIRLLSSGYQVCAEPVPGGSASGTASTPHTWDRFNKLTWREIEVVQLILRGWSNAEIAEALTLSGATVKSHVHSLMGKLELRNRIDVITTAYTTGFVRPDVPRPTVSPRLASNSA